MSSRPSKGLPSSYQIINFCTMCGKPVEEGKGRPYFTCSDECAERLRKDKPEKIFCVWCGKEKDATTTVYNNSRIFCTPNCSNTFYRKRNRIIRGKPAYCIYCKEPLGVDEQTAHAECARKKEEEHQTVVAFCERFGTDDIVPDDVAKYCRNCGKELPEIGPEKRHDCYCSDECAAACDERWKSSESEKLFCLTCGKEFRPKMAQRDARYCSTRCNDAVQLKLRGMRLIPKEERPTRLKPKVCSECLEWFQPSGRKEKLCPKCEKKKQSKPKPSWNEFEEACRKAEAEGKHLSYGQWQAKRSGY